MIAALWARCAGWIVGVGAVLAALAATWAAGRQSGTHSARTRAVEAELHARETRDEVDRAVARQPDPAQQLRDRWSRD